jgi:hypothetical protein
MSALPFLRRFAGDQHGTVAEFALVLPVALLFLLGVVDAGRYLYEVNRLEKATQMGARFAVVTDPVANELAGYSFVGVTVDGSPLTQGDRIPASALGQITCDHDSCDCTSGTCLGGTLTWESVPFGNILARVQLFKPDATAAMLKVEYRGSGLGYAGDPNGMDVAPLTTVRLSGIPYTPFVLFGSTSFDLPESSFTLTMEDASGTESN